MATQTSTRPRPARPDIGQLQRVSPDAKPRLAQSQDGGHSAEHPAVTLEERGQKRSPSTATHFTRTTAVDGGVAILAVLALFIAGFMRTRTERAALRLLAKAEDIDVPLLLPVTFAGTVWELVAGRRSITDLAAEQRKAK